MILTGKTKEEFLKWLRNRDYPHFTNEYELLVQQRFVNNCPLRRNALIVEYFDSVGVYINITVTYGFNWYIEGLGGSDFNTRQEATIQAIKKANEIRNARM